MPQFFRYLGKQHQTDKRIEIFAVYGTRAAALCCPKACSGILLTYPCLVLKPKVHIDQSNMARDQVGSFNLQFFKLILSFLGLFGVP